MPEEKKKTKEKVDWTAEGALPYGNTPVVKAAFDCLKECQFRFRNVPSDAKALAREVKEKLQRIMVYCMYARAEYRVVESLHEALGLTFEVIVTIRIMVETNAITKKDFANISQYSSSLVRQMRGWAQSEEKKASEEKGLFDK